MLSLDGGIMRVPAVRWMAAIMACVIVVAGMVMMAGRFSEDTDKGLRDGGEGDHLVPPDVYLGNVLPGDTRFKVAVSNPGATSLIVRGIQTNCGCMTANSGGFTLPSGATREVEFTLSVQDTMRGPQQKLIAFRTDARQPATVTVHYAVSVPPGLTAIPNHIEYRRWPGRKGGRSEVLLVGPKPEPLAVLSATVTNPHVGAEVEAGAQMGSRLPFSQSLRISFDDAAIDAPFQDTLSVVTSQGKITIPITVVLTQPIRCEPPALVLGLIPAEGLASTARLTLLVPDGTAFCVHGARSDQGSLSVAAPTPETRAAQHELSVRLRCDATACAGPERATITVDTDRGTVTIPCTWFIYP